MQTNVSNSVEARALCDRLVRARLAACANVWPVNSEYWWDSRLQKEREVTVHLKTAPSVLQKLIKAVRAALKWTGKERMAPEVQPEKVRQQQQ